MSDNQITELLDLAHHAWSIAVCAMQGVPIPASWGNAVEKGLRERGIDVDKLPYIVPDVVRCRDCKRFDDKKSYCNFFKDEVWFGGFCAWAERKDGGDAE